ncbi:MAG: hypothetical protein M5R41_03515 [Bacteroidia bacterium]|nr:hypothetical protein [Bacteroidia bacterium]
MRRGYDRGYTTFDEDTQALRGRLLSTETMRRNLLRSARVRCSRDELSHDILHNRILKTTVVQLLRTYGIDESIAANLVDHRHRMHTVSEIPLSDSVFSRVVLHRNNLFYDFLLKISQLIFHNLLPAEEQGHYYFLDFINDQVKMRLLFEEFIRNFYRLEQNDWKVDRDTNDWQLDAVTEDSARFLPAMQTDVSLVNRHRRIVIECKFTASHFQQRFAQSKETFRSSHMYQLNAYLQNLHDRYPEQEIEGILLYPTVRESLRHEFLNKRGQRVRIWSIDLNAPWRQIHEELLGLVAR